MRILIDADACPVAAVTARLAKKYQIPCVAFCDTSHQLHLPDVQTVTVSKGADSVDFALVNQAVAGDVVVTQDYGLAAMCLSRGAHPIRQDGLWYREENIDALLTARYTAGEIRRSGGRTKGPKKRGSKEDLIFAESMEKLLQSLILAKNN